MLPRLDRLALHTKVAQTGVYVPCTPEQDTLEAAHAWLRQHPGELDLYTMEPLAQPIGEDTIAYWNEYVFRWENGQIGANKVEVPIPKAWADGGPHALIRVSHKACTEPGQLVEYVRKVSLYLAFVSQYKNYPYGVDVVMPPDADHQTPWITKRKYPEAFKGRGESQNFIVPLRTDDNERERSYMSSVLLSFLHECETYGLYNSARMRLENNPFPPGDGVPGSGQDAWPPMERYRNLQGIEFQWNDFIDDEPVAAINTGTVDVDALVEALAQANNLEPGTRWHRLLMVYNAMGVKDGAQRSVWPARELQFMRHPHGLSTLVQLINDNVDAEGAWWRNEMSFNFVRDALRTLHRVFAEPISNHAWIWPISFEVTQKVINGGTLQALLKILNNVNFKDRQFNDLQKYCVKLLSALVLSSPSYMEADNLLIQFGGIQIIARAFSLTRGRALKSLIKLLGSLWSSDRHEWNQTVIDTLQSNDEVLARLVRLACTLPQSEIINVDEGSLRHSAIAMGLDQLQLPGDLDFGNGAEFLARVTEHALTLLRIIDQIDADNTYFKWRAMGDQYFYLTTATYGMQFLTELAYQGTKEQKDDALDILFELSKDRTNLAFFVAADVIHRLITMLSFTPQATLTNETKAKVARVLVEIVAHYPSIDFVKDTVDWNVINQFDVGSVHSYLLKYWESLDHGPTASWDTRQYHSMLESLARLRLSFNRYIENQNLRRPGIFPDPRFHEFD